MNFVGNRPDFNNLVIISWYHPMRSRNSIDIQKKKVKKNKKKKLKRWNSNINGHYKKFKKALTKK